MGKRTDGGTLHTDAKHELLLVPAAILDSQTYVPDHAGRLMAWHLGAHRDGGTS